MKTRNLQTTWLNVTQSARSIKQLSRPSNPSPDKHFKSTSPSKRSISLYKRSTTGASHRWRNEWTNTKRPIRSYRKKIPKWGTDYKPRGPRFSRKEASCILKKSMKPRLRPWGGNWFRSRPTPKIDPQMILNKIIFILYRQKCPNWGRKIIFSKSNYSVFHQNSSRTNSSSSTVNNNCFLT